MPDDFIDEVTTKYVGLYERMIDKRLEEPVANIDALRRIEKDYTLHNFGGGYTEQQHGAQACAITQAYQVVFDTAI